jgi:hypothetical protein
MAHSVLRTDEARYCTHLGRQFMSHETVNHGEDEYVNDRGAGTSLAEGYLLSSSGRSTARTTRSAASTCPGI